MAIKIRIVSDFNNKGISQANKSLDALSRNAGIALAAVAAATVVIGVKSVQEFAKFDAAMVKSQAIMGDLTNAMKDDMASAAREVAKSTTFSAEQAGESFFFLASAGLDAASSVAALPKVAAFAQAGMFDMALATDLLTDAQSALGLTIKDDAVANMENMVRVSDVLVKANTLANASVEQFSTALTNKAGAAMRALGKDVEEGVAVLAAFADQGIKGEIAGTQLSIVLRDLQTKAIKNAEEFEQFGLKVFDSSGEMRNMGDIIGNLEVVLGGMSDETKKATLLQLGFSDKSISAMTALLGTSDAIKSYETSLRSASGVTDEIAEKQLKTLTAQFELLKSELQDVAIRIGGELAPEMESLVGVVKDLLPVIGDKLVEAVKKVDWEKLATDLGNFIVLIVDNLENIGKFVKIIGAAAAALVLYTTVTKIAATTTAILNSTLLLSPWGLAAVAIAGVTTMLVLNNGAVEKNIDNYRLLTSKTDQTNYATKNLADEYRDAAWAADKYSIESDELKAAQLRIAGATDMARGEVNRFNNLSLSKIRGEMLATAKLGERLADQQRQLYFAMKGMVAPAFGSAFGGTVPEVSGGSSGGGGSSSSGGGGSSSGGGSNSGGGGFSSVFADAAGLQVDSIADIAKTVAFLDLRVAAAEQFAATVGDPMQAASALAKASDWKTASGNLSSGATGVGTVININVKTDTTQSNAMVGNTLGKLVSKYVNDGGQIVSAKG